MPDSGLKGKRIMIFDDDEDILSICTYVLEEEGWQVICYSDCIDILSRVSAWMPDVILMDNWIPDEGGIVATQKLKNTEEVKYIPVIYFSANNSVETLAAAAAADMYLPKPFDIDVLKEIVVKAISLWR